MRTLTPLDLAENRWPDSGPSGSQMLARGGMSELMKPLRVGQAQVLNPGVGERQQNMAVQLITAAGGKPSEKIGNPPGREVNSAGLNGPAHVHFRPS